MRGVIQGLAGRRDVRPSGPGFLDASSPARRTVAWSAVLYLWLGAGLVGYVPWWAISAGVPLLYVRLALALHETMHRHAAGEISLWLRLAVVLESPLVLGYREHRALHLRHHRFNGGLGDPDRPLIASRAPIALIHALLVPERAFVQWIRSRGMDFRLAWECGVRALLFAAVVCTDATVFLAYWISLRTSIGLAGFVFHHVLHARDGRIGCFTLPGGPHVLQLGRWLFGREPMLILSRHRAHHLWPRTPVEDLPELPDDLELPSGRLTPAVRHAVLAKASRDMGGIPCAA